MFTTKDRSISKLTCLLFLRAISLPPSDRGLWLGRSMIDRMNVEERLSFAKPHSWSPFIDPLTVWLMEHPSGHKEILFIFVIYFYLPFHSYNTVTESLWRFCWDIFVYYTYCTDIFETDFILISLYFISIHILIHIYTTKTILSQTVIEFY
jgi:hypothetical protein